MKGGVLSKDQEAILKQKRKELLKVLLRTLVKEKKKQGFGKYDLVRVRCASTIDWGAHARNGRNLKSKPSELRKMVFEPQLLNALKEFDENPPNVIDLPNGGKRFVGTCAEDDAANSLMKVFKDCCNKYIDIDTLYFSLAIVPKTLKRKKYCDVCRSIFGL